MTEVAFDLPVGEVALVFTDIEGSTRLLHELGALYVSVLEEHNARVRGAMTARGGTEIKNEGDGFLFAFGDPSEAILACADVQRAMLADGWPHGRPVRVRIGAHHGAVTLLERDYIGLAVHETARVCDAATGGQIVLTDVLVKAAGHLPRDVSLLHLGAFRLRDFPEARRLHQACVDGLAKDFPPLRSQSAHRTIAIPAPPSPLVARSNELAEVELLLSGAARLVTLTGPGGVGKTRLAIEAAWRMQPHFTGGIWLVDLAGVTDPDGILPAIVRSIGARDDGERSLQRVSSRLGDEPSLFVLDNFEQVMDGAKLVADLLEACPALSVLATSRERLRLRAEHEVVLSGLDLDDAVQLFSALARAHASALDDDEQPVAEHICRHLSGMPLALELVASRLRDRSPDELLAELREGLDVVADDARDRPERHQAMRDTIAWSWDLLGPLERQTLAALSATAGSSPMDLISALASAAGVRTPVEDVVSTLVAKSLLVERTDDAEPGVRVLEVIRQFAQERLAAEPEKRRAVVAAHAQWCADLVARCAPHIVGPDAPVWLDRLDRQHDNIRLALEHEAFETLLEQITPLMSWWTTRGHWEEARTILGRALMRGIDDAATRVRVMTSCATVAVRLGELNAATDLAEEALPLASAAAAPPDLLPRALNVLGEIARITGRIDVSEGYYTKALAAASWAEVPHLAATATSNLGVLFWSTNRFAEARHWWSDALKLAESMDDHRGIAILKSDLGLLDLAEGHLDQAEERINDALATGQRLDDPLVTAQGLLNLGEVAKARGDEVLARKHYQASLDVCERVGDAPYTAAALLHLSLVTDDLVEARAWLERAHAVAVGCGDARRTEEARKLLDVLETMEAGDAAAPRVTTEPASSAG